MELKKMYPPQKDSPSTFILGDITPTDVLVTVANAAILPKVVPFPLTIGIDKTQTETVMVTEINTVNNQLKITRGAQALAWMAGAKVARVFTSADLKTVQENLETTASAVTVLEGEVVDLQNGKLNKNETPGSVYAVGSAGEQTVVQFSNSPSGRTIAQRLPNGELAVATPTGSFSAANKEFVEGITNPLSTGKVDRTELPQVITDWAYSPDGTKLTVTITRYNASNKTISTFTKVIPAVSDTTIGVMTPEAYNEITALRNAVNALQQQGGRFIGVSFATKAKLDAYTIPASTNQGDFTYVLDDETHADGTTRYIYNAVSKKFEFAFIVESDPIGLATSEQAGIVKSVSLTPKWEPRHSLADVTSVCYGNGIFVAVCGIRGESPGLVTSKDGKAWTAATLPDSGSPSWSSVCYGNGIFVAVRSEGAGQSLATSTDGLNWTTRAATGIGDNWKSICYGLGLFVAVGTLTTGHAIMTSPDGITWTPRSYPSSAQNDTWYSVCFGNNTFVTVGSSSTKNRVMTSIDGINWIKQDAAEDVPWGSVCYGNGLFVAVNSGRTVGTPRIMTSASGVSWNGFRVNLENAWKSICYGDGRFVAVGTSIDDTTLMLESIDGATWTTSELTEYYWTSICYGNGRFVAGTQANGILSLDTTLPKGKIYVEADGTMSVIGWDDLNAQVTNLETGLTALGKKQESDKTALEAKINAIPKPVIATSTTAGLVKSSEINSVFLEHNMFTSYSDLLFASVCYGNGLFVAVANSGTTHNLLVTSPDGITWTPRTSATNKAWTSVCYGGGMFVAVAESGVGYRVMTSPDGITWTPRDSAADNAWTSVCYGNGLFVAVSKDGDDRVMTSVDGISWDPQLSMEGDWSSVCYGNGRFVAVSSANFMTSTDGRYWYAANTIPGPAHVWTSVCYGNGRFVAVAPAMSPTEKNLCVTSTDGITWTVCTTISNAFNSVCYGNGLFVAVGQDYVIMSHDGVTWNMSLKPAGANGTLISVCYGNGRFVAVSMVSTMALHMIYDPTVVVDAKGVMSTRGLSALRTDTEVIEDEVFRLQLKVPTLQNDMIYPNSSPVPGQMRSPKFNNPRPGQQFSFVSLFDTDGNTAVTIESLVDGVTMARDVYTDLNSSKRPKLKKNMPYTIFYDQAHDCFFLKASASAEGNAVAEDVLAGKTFSNENDSGVQGTLMVGEGATPPKELKPWIAGSGASAKSWQSVCYGNGLFVAVSYSGTGNRIMTSPDGIAWTSRTSPVDNNWRSVCYGNGLFVAVAMTGTGDRVMTSPDGITWTLRTSAADNSWFSICYGNGRFVAVSGTGTGNRVMTSFDGITWTSRTPAVDNSWMSVCYGNGLFVAVAYNGTGNRVMTSPDGITWTSRTSAADNGWYSVCYGNGLFVAVSYNGTGNRVMTSPDGITWTSRTSAANNSWKSVCYGDGLFVAVSESGTGNRIMTSPDGITWTLRTSGEDNNWQSVCYGNGLFVAVSDSGSIYRVMTMPYSLEEVPNKISTGVNLKKFVPRTGAVTLEWASICYGNGLFVVVAYRGTGNRVMTSPDGVNWTSRTSAADNDWTSVCYGNGLFVAVADTGSLNRVMTSPDGINWTIRQAAAANDWRSVCYGNGLFVAVSNTGTGNRVMTSPDGVNWTIRQSAVDNPWSSVCYGNGLFVAVADSGDRVMTSSNGINWVMRYGVSNTGWKSVCYGNGLFVSVSIYGSSGNQIMTSPDGVTWTTQVSDKTNRRWRSVCYGNGIFVAVTYKDINNPTMVMTSIDGVTWIMEQLPSDDSWRSICYGNGLFVAVAEAGSGGRVITASVVRRQLSGVSKNVQKYSVSSTRDVTVNSITFPLNGVVPNFTEITIANIVASLRSFSAASSPYYNVLLSWTYDPVTGYLKCTSTNGGLFSTSQPATTTVDLTIIS